ncbi:carboxylating nicotinate-nucleotide diphosphorylase [Desulfonauticus submarinus]|uniref:Probable nicotinate-nucleotide pyrophosphorylase [carboxylating] n=1 Tax=Desulfonauticus submarinus TaxID=206665 RepID=A0A1H0FXZ3_9BACT|nr:carboxylating nicotinate-nucleotide diphosphorylase [Desulfonauticus submarinus]SDN99441.1 nicotinate-nucleotide pyrophosphorylase [carboxylating] [Desulfonauticus submarinus]
MSEIEFFPEKYYKTHLLTLIKLALAEDGQDLTSNYLFSNSKLGVAHIISKQTGIIAGLPLLQFILKQNQSDLKLTFLVKEGQKIFPKTKIVKISGPVKEILAYERIFLNFLSHLSGIATLTSHYVEKVSPYNVILLDTRKTLPGHRVLEKYAVRVGGGQNHRLNLEEMLMLKDNHLIAYPSIKQAVQKLRTQITHCPPIEVECSTLSQVKEAVESKVNRIMLDNMSPDLAQKALQLIPSHIETEISGNITLQNIEAYAYLRPNYISVGQITHSATSLDLSLKIGDLNE